MKFPELEIGKLYEGKLVNYGYYGDRVISNDCGIHEEPFEVSAMHPVSLECFCVLDRNYLDYCRVKILTAKGEVGWLKGLGNKWDFKELSEANV